MLSLLSTLPALEQVFDDVMRDSFGTFTTAGTFTPTVDVQTDDDRMLFMLDVPGCKPDDLTVEIEGTALRVRGERKFEGGAKGHAVFGRRYGAFDWSWSLPDGLDTENMKASLDSGVLQVEIPKHPKAKPRRIPIASGAANGDAKQITESSQDTVKEG